MFRIDGSGVASSLPAPAAPGTPGFFQGGNALTGVPATVVTPDWANMTQEELVAVVLAAGIALDTTKTNFGQLLAALNKMYLPQDHYNSSGIGYSIFPGGWIKQSFLTPAVTFSAPAGTVFEYAFTFPTPFTEFCSDIVGSDGANAGITWGSFATTLTGGNGYVWSLGTTGTGQGRITAWGK